jgi:hypothetical protein
VKLRVLFDIVDTEQDHARIKDCAYLTDGDTSTSLTGPIGGYRRGSVWSPRVHPSAGRIAIKFSSDATNCCPDGSGGIDCGCSQAPTSRMKESRRSPTSISAIKPAPCLSGRHCASRVNTLMPKPICSRIGTDTTLPTTVLSRRAPLPGSKAH